YTPAEQKAAKAAAQSFRENPDFDTYEVLTQLGIGEALISVLDEEGIPTVVKKATILPPQSQMDVLPEAQRESIIKGSLLFTKYDQSIDRDSAYEFLQRKSAEDAEAAARAAEEAAAQKQREKEEAAALKQKEREEAAALRQKEKEEAAALKRTKSTVSKVASSAAGTIGREVGNEIGKSIGGSFGKRLGGNLGASLGRGILNTFLKF
ncbi:MAG: DUF853 domain-containing protein, partial [Lachnospiraceae bacterium]|nr:DUF853 domain-containing protein [Lachnospiraceae bacterium]